MAACSACWVAGLEMSGTPGTTGVTPGGYRGIGGVTAFKRYIRICSEHNNCD